MRVIDLAEENGEMCGRYLADLGAEVIRVEPPGGSTSRLREPRYEGIGLAFAARNAGKRGLTLDLERPEGQARLRDLLATAELLLESHRPGRLAELGLDLAGLLEEFPHLVVLSITDFGQTGPRREWVATDWVHLAMGAVLARSGRPGEPPLMPPGALGVESAVIQAAWAGLAAYWNRLHTGRGDHIDLSIHEGVLQVVDPAFGTGGTAGAGSRWYDLPEGRPDVAHYYPVFPSSDGHVRMAVLAPRQWRGLRAWLGEPEEFQDRKYDLVHERFGAADRLYPLIGKLFASGRSQDLVDEGQRRGVPLAPVLDPAQVLRAEHYAERGAIGDVEIAPGLTARLPTGFVEIDGVRSGVRAPAPALGEADDALPAKPPVAASANTSGKRLPLAGVRVLDLGVIVQGAEAGRMFADLGAEVIKVENRAFPDQGRVAAGTQMNASFAWGNHSKLSLGLNLREAEGVALFKRFVAESDVVLSNFKPGTMESLGLGYDVLREINPRLVMGSSSAVGSSGVWKTWMGYGPLVRAAAGLTSLWRTSRTATIHSDAATVYPDHLAARVTAVAVLAGLIAARRTGRGCHVESSQAEVILTAFSDRFLEESLLPGSFGPEGNLGRRGAPWGVYPCAGEDQWCVVTVRDDEDWQHLCATLNLPPDPGLATQRQRFERRDAVERLVGDWTRTRSPIEVAELLQSAGVPAGPMVRPADLARDPHLAARRFWTTLPQPGLTAPLPTEARPFRSSGIPDLPPRPAPFHGEHTRRLCVDILGMSQAAIDALVAAGILEEVDPWARVGR
jgi:crotonobetainyl-CoA:carnitine CoA-transferase CaiB-like acyl-CoA transferase